VDGVLTMKDDIKDYADRGTEMTELSFFDFFIETYEGDRSQPSLNGRGRKPNGRVPYMEGTGHNNKCRVYRTKGHETMPNFIGGWFPRNDVDDQQDMYCASMLALFSPWRVIGDLKMENQTFKQAFDIFVGQTDDRTKYMMANIQYQHECVDSALKKRATEEEDKPIIALTLEETGDNLVTGGMLLTGDSQSVEYTSRDIEHAIASEFSVDDKLYAEVALNIAMDCNIFEEEPPIGVSWKGLAKPATREQLIEFCALDKLVQAVTKNRAAPDLRACVEPTANLWTLDAGDAEPSSVEASVPAGSNLSHTTVLNDEQRRAHDIMTNHLQATLNGRKPRQLLMMVMGPGGTGKTTMLNAITDTFERFNAAHLLKKTALSGVAASLVGGTTLHWFAGIPPQTTPQSDIWPDNSSKTVKERRTKNISAAEWLAVDESGMCTTDVLTLLSQVCGKVRAGDGSATSTAPFGGLNVLLMGDFHQFPPVGNSNAALYCPALSRNTSIVGKAIYLQFETVIMLVKQERITDYVWMHLLQRARIGECTKADVAEIRALVLSNPKCDVPDFSVLPWSEAVLVTHRNAVRAAWNRAALRKHCAQTGNLLYICDAEDTLGDSHAPLNMEQKVIVASMKLGDSKNSKGTKKLRHRIEIAIGTRV
jgi:hypothetical protein